MNHLTDGELLRDFAEGRSEAAFAELVRRHVNLVYSAALRMVHDRHLAEDVAQSVFLALAQNIRLLRNRRALPGWLHHTTQHLAANAVRADVRRRAREQEAAAMNEVLGTQSSPNWELIAPQLDAALGELSEPDRDAVLLRYFENKSLREVGQALGTSDDTAQKRVSRAVDRLREFFIKRGVTVSAGGLVAVISANAIHAAPPDLTVSISTAATLAEATAAAATKAVPMTALKKTILGVALVAAVGSVIYYHARKSWSPQTQLLTLRGKPAILARDDGQAAGNLSVAGDGHVVRFEAPGPDSFLTAVQIHGKRYGPLAPSRQDFHVWLCDTNAHVIADFPFPYARFQTGPAQWVTLDTKPTKVPARFLIVVGFNPTLEEGVHVSWDGQSSGESFTGLPGQTPQAFRDGDWLIRVSLDQAL